MDSKMKAIACIFLTAWIFAGCMKKETKPMPFSTDMNALGRLIRLPHQPKTVRWSEITMGKPGLGPTDYSLIAVLEYDDTTCTEILGESTRELEGNPAMLTKEDAEGWLFPLVRKQLEPDGEAFYRVKGVVFQPTLFAKPPFVVGYVIRIEKTNFLFLTLSTT